MKKGIVIMIAVSIGVFCMANTQAQAEEDVSSIVGSVDIHGFISQGYLQTDDNNYLAEDTEDGTFHFNEFGINFATQPADKLRLGMQLFARDLGDVGNDEIELDWALADYRWRDWAGLRVGAMKVPYGFYNESRDIDALRTNILLPQSVYSELLRDVLVGFQGVGVYGHIPLDSIGGGLSYQFQVGTNNIDKDSGSARWVEGLAQGIAPGALEVTDDIDMDDTYVGSLEWRTPLEGLRIGASLFYVKEAKSEGELTQDLWGIPAGTVFGFEMDEPTSYCLSAEYTHGALVLAVEYSEIELDAITDLFPVIPIKSEGYYGSASYRFTDWFELGTYYSIYYPDADDKDGDDREALGLPDHGAWLKDLALTTRFDINDYWIFKLEGHLMDGTANVHTPENSDDAEEDWFLFAAKLTFTF